MKRKILIICSVFVMLFFLYSEYKTEMCNRNQGFKKYVKIQNGEIIDNVDAEYWHDPLYRIKLRYTNKDEDSFPETEIKIKEYVFYASCEGDFDRFYDGSRFYIVKFTNKPKFDFIMAESDVELKLDQEQLNSEYYINLQKRIVYPGKEYLAKLRKKPDQSEKVTEADFTFYYLRKFNIKWLNEEPLDEEHYLGVWQDGFLFKSKTEGEYVWLATH
jgi:hypothetical protein